MFAVYADKPNPEDPLAALTIGTRPEPKVPEGWVAVSVTAASLNMHDLWTLRGVGIKPDKFPMILGMDAAGVLADGTAVVVHPVIASPDGPVTRRLILVGLFSPRCTREPWRTQWLSRGATSSKSAGFVHEPCRRIGHGVADGVPDVVHQVGAAAGADHADPRRLRRSSTALVQLGHAAGIRVWVTGRSEEKRALASSSERTRCSSQGPGCRRRWTLCSRPSAKRPGRTRCEPSTPAGPSSLRLHQRPEPRRGPAAVVFPAASGRGFHHGNPPGAGRSASVHVHSWDHPAGRPGAAHVRGRNRLQGHAQR